MSDDASRRSHAVAVGCLMALTGVVFGYEVWLGWDGSPSGAQSRFIAAWGLLPREFLRELRSPGATSQIVWLTPLSAMFLHSGPLHLFGNWLFLWVFGTPMERRLGHLRFAALYFGCGLAAAAIHVASNPDSYLACIGASGAVSGVLGAYAFSDSQRGTGAQRPILQNPMFALLAVWVVIQIMSGLHDRSAKEGGLAWTAHAGGFLAGAALIRVLERRPSGGSHSDGSERVSSTEKT